ALFSGSPVKRIGRDRFIRNVLIAAGNSGDEGLAGRCETLAEDPSPLVRGAAVWALSKLSPRDKLLELAATTTEADPDVRAEWDLATASSNPERHSVPA
ncbi:HEAT repeat domain-containing protein, partial [Rhizobiaceae sp. 2RAB30]